MNRRSELARELLSFLIPCPNNQRKSKLQGIDSRFRGNDKHKKVLSCVSPAKAGIQESEGLTGFISFMRTKHDTSHFFSVMAFAATSKSPNLP